MISRLSSKLLASAQAVQSTFSAYRQIVARQIEVAREVDRNLVNIRQLSDRSGSGARQTRKASGELNRLAHEMDSLVARFRPVSKRLSPA